MSGRTRNHLQSSHSVASYACARAIFCGDAFDVHLIQDEIVGNMRETLAEIAFKANGTRQIKQQPSKLGRKAVAR